MNRSRPAHLILVALVLAAPAGAADEKSAMPKPHERSYSYDLIDQCAIRPLTRFFDAAHGVRWFTHDPIQAANVDADDQVRLPSTWWQPRIGFRDVTPQQLAAAPGPGTGPAPGKWKVTSAKFQGVSPGFQIKDAHGDKFLIKLDVPNFPGAATGADVIGSHLLWGAGYNVPDNVITDFTRDDLEIDAHATATDAHGRKHALTKAQLDLVLARTAAPVNGRYRCVASRYLSGKPLGPFEYRGRRKDDPDDLIPHERRRELRGLWPIAAWLNHIDSRGANSLDMWVTENGRSFVRHYLIDFGSTLGSTATTVRRTPDAGHTYYVDYGVMTRSLGTLGLYRPKYDEVDVPDRPAIGYIEDAGMFDPRSWRPDYPNPAFDERTLRDIRWGARIVAGFTDAHIRAAVATGQLPPDDEAYLAGVLIRRRDAIVRQWLGDGEVPGRMRVPASRAALGRDATR